jgi:hypothetical protein
MMEPTLDKEYLSGQLGVDALSVVFGKPESLLLIDKNDDVSEELPIGFELLCDRLSKHLIQMDYNERCGITQ